MNPFLSDHPHPTVKRVGVDAATWFARALVVALSLLMAFRSVYFVLSGNGRYLALLQDDFYYYAITARNIALHGFSSFDGFTETNGYQPLWMGVLVPIVAAFGDLNGWFFLTVALLCAAAAVIAFELILRLGRRLFTSETFLPAVALLVSVELLRISFWAMETTILLPLAPLFVLALLRENAGRWHGLTIGLLASLVMLARLDAGILVAMLLMAWFFSAEKTQRSRTALFIAVGTTPLFLYLIWNQAEFGSIMPISGRAKQLADGLFFSTNFVDDFTDYLDGLAVLLLAPIGIVVALLRRDLFATTLARMVAILLLAFPFVYYATLGFISDWAMFAWYVYPMPFALLALGGMAYSLIRSTSVVNRAGIAATILAGGIAVAIIVPSAIAQTFGRRLDPNSPYRHALRLAHFAEDNPGRYAMGDRAGITSLLIGQPLMQLEGLVGDTSLLGHIDRGDSLEAVFARYGIDYFIYTEYGAPRIENGCYVAEVPNRRQSGVRSPRMPGRFCATPVLHIRTARTRPRNRIGLVPVDDRGEAHTMVFDVRTSRESRGKR